MTRTRGIVLSLLLLATFVTIYVASPVTNVLRFTSGRSTPR